MASKNWFATSFFALFCFLAVANADAAQRAHVASYGLDSNTAFNCDAAHPCRFFQAATTVVDPNGEVVALDSAGYGAVTLTQSISLVAPTGVYAGISVFPLATGVRVATPGINVVLRGLTINSQGGANGVAMTAGTSLSIENCVISNFSVANYGVHVTTTAKVRIIDTLLRDNSEAIRLENGAGADIVRATITGSGTYGILVHGNVGGATTAAIVTDSIVSGGNFAIWAVSSVPNATAHASVIRSTVANANIGVASSNYAGAGPALLTLSESLVTRNTTGLQQAQASTTSATLRSLGNNTLDQNTTDVVGTLTTIALR